MWLRIKNCCTYIDHGFDMCGTFLLILGGSLITLTVFTQVLLRYVFKSPLFGIEEFSRLVGVWVYFIGAIYGTRSDSHVQGDIAARLCDTNRAQAILKTVTWVLSSLLCVIFLYYSAKYCVWLYGTGERTTGLWWPRIYSVGSLLFGAIFMTVYSIVNVIKYLEMAFGKSISASGGEL